MTVAIVAGALANKPLSGGEAWVRLSWVLGLRRLGLDAFFVEVLAERATVDERRAPSGFAESINRAHFESVVREFGLAGRAALLDESGGGLSGLPPHEVMAAAEVAEVVFNLSGHLPPGPVRDAPRRRVYVDLDPGFTQVWAEDRSLPFAIAGHDRHVTVGLNLGRPGCRVPTAGVEWIPTLPPVVLEHWPAAAAPAAPLRFTTVATWRSPFGAIEVAGELATLKHHEFRRFAGLPEGVGEAEFEIALDIHPGDEADLRRLRELGWAIAAPCQVASSPQRFRDYLQGSDAEFSVAQGAYVASRSGWFSDRTAAYLASGRPALVQATGVEALPLGDGLIAFSSPAEAAAGARRIIADPGGHAEAARRIAAERLDSDLVLARLLEAIGVEA